MSKEKGTNDRTRERQKPLYVYDRDLIMTLLIEADILSPVLSMTEADKRIGTRRAAVDGIHSMGLPEEALEPFEQDPTHTAFCEWYFEDKDDRDVSPAA